MHYAGGDLLTYGVLWSILGLFSLQSVFTMSDDTLNTLRSQLNKAAFLVARLNDSEEAHSALMACYPLLDRLQPQGEQAGWPNHAVRDHSHHMRDEEAEVKRVGSRLRLWARRTEQINARILRAFLLAQREGVKPITLEEIRERIPGTPIPKLEANFNSMRFIASNNHGKVFDYDGLEVSIWPPVAAFVREFEQVVLGCISDDGTKVRR